MIQVPPNTIAILPFNDYFKGQHNLVIQSLHNCVKRDWFIKHAYYCLPLTIGNQYGFVIKSLYDFTVHWNGGINPSDVTIKFDDPVEYGQLIGLQKIDPHFGMGTFTIQLGFILRTPEGVNIMTGNPPNYFIDGITHMTGVVETDNLRRDFTFNLKITRAGHDIKIRKGDWIGYFIPYPRHFVDPFSVVDSQDIFTQDQVKEEQKCSDDFGIERSKLDVHKPRGNGRRYWNGEDVYGNQFPDHQKNLDK